MSYKILFTFTSLLLVVLNISTKAEGNGEGRGGGGSVILDNKDHLNLADNYFIPKIESCLPENSKARIDLQKQYPLAYKRFERIFNFLNRRIIKNQNFVAASFSETLDGFELFYLDAFARHYQNQEKHIVKQVAFTFSCEKNIPDYQNKPYRVEIRRVIQINKTLFEKLSVDMQALILLHEVLHHHRNGSHDFLAPLISSVAKILPILDRQDRRETTPLSEKEYDAVKVFIKNLNLFFTDEHFVPNYNYLINRKGGGFLIFGDKKDAVDFEQLKRFEDNFISIDSNVYINKVDLNDLMHKYVIQSKGTLFEATLLDRNRKKNGLTNNTFFNAELSIVIPEIGNFQCDHNQFSDLSIRESLVHFVCLNTSGSKFENVQALTLAESFLFLEGDSLLVKESNVHGFFVLKAGTNIEKCTLGSNYDVNKPSYIVFEESVKINNSKLEYAGRLGLKENLLQKKGKTISNLIIWNFIEDERLIINLLIDPKMTNLDFEGYIHSFYSKNSHRPILGNPNEITIEIESKRDFYEKYTARRVYK